MTCLLVSDKNCDIAGAAVDVSTGALRDPWDRAGIAHFLEHMLFMGSEKYPDEKEYREFFQKHAGRSNACTWGTHTNYHFQVDKEWFDEAVDRFA